ncbi:MAG: zinc-dependent alcohol dehydrogenase family protein [Acidimicrobiia bacterium]
MRAAMFETFAGPVEVTTLADPQPPPGGVVIRVGANGICRSDWHGWMGHDPDVRLPHVPGHELAGTIADVGTGIEKWQVGDRVVVPFAGGCGVCRECRAGNHHICDNYFQPGFTAWGGFAELVAVRYADVNLVRLPTAMGFADAAALGCRFATSFQAVVNRGRVADGEWFVVHGCGGIGLSAVMVGAALGARVIAVDISDDKLQAAAAVGAVHSINAAATPDVIAAVHGLTDGGAHASIDALGSTETCRNSIRCLRKRGRHLQVGLLVGEHAMPRIPMELLHSLEIELVGSHGMPVGSYPQMLDMIGGGTLDPARLVDSKVTLTEGAEHLMRMGDFPGVGTTVIDRF